MPPISAPARTRHYNIVGSAYDYAVRFEIKRRIPRARMGPVVAELARKAIVARKLDLSNEKARQLSASIGDALKACRAYLQNPTPNLSAREAMTRACIVLAQADLIYRQHEVLGFLGKVDERDVKDITRMLILTRWEKLVPSLPIILNPSFGAISRIVRGADADLISGRQIIDLKTTSEAVTPAHVAQVLSYVVIARAARRIGARIPAVSSAGLYYARHGAFVEFELSGLIETEDFRACEISFFEAASDLYGTVLPRQLRTKPDTSRPNRRPPRRL